MRARFIAPWKDSTEKPVIYHCISRVVERRLAFGKEAKEQLRTYFSDGAVLGSRAFVDGVFRACRERFGQKRMSGARKLRGNAAPAAGALWSVRDLRKGLG